MIITDQFVILNLPKTGSSFVRKVIKDIFWNRNKFIKRNSITEVLHRLGILSLGYKELMSDHPTIPNYRDQHGCYDQIPDKDKNKTILSVVRSPYSRLESQYKFKWWVKYPPIEKEQIERYFPNFPDLTVQQFLKLQLLIIEKWKEKYGIERDLKIGLQSIQFIQFYFKNHKKVLSNVNEDYILSGAYKKDMCDITLIRNENLGKELSLFLSKNGFSEEEVNYVRNHEKVNVTKGYKNKSFVNADLIQFVNEYEWILLEFLSYLGFGYKKEV